MKIQIMIRVRYSKELLEEKVKDCYSLSELARRLGLKPEGSNPKTLKTKLDLFNVDYSHFRGGAWNVFGHPNFGNSGKTKEDYFSENSTASSANVRKRLLNNRLKENKCECCGVTEWMGKPITIHLHHINGNWTDNRLENLQMLCPNCHAQTDNYCSKNKK